MSTDAPAREIPADELAEALRADHRPVCHWSHEHEPGACCGEFRMVCHAEGEDWPCTTDRLLAAYDRRGAAESLLRHYLGTIARQLGRPVTWSALSQDGEIEVIGEGVLAEIERLREAEQAAAFNPAREEAVKAVVREWPTLRNGFPSKVLWDSFADALDALARAHEDEGQDR